MARNITVSSPSTNLIYVLHRVFKQLLRLPALHAALVSLLILLPATGRTFLPVAAAADDASTSTTDSRSSKRGLIDITTLSTQEQDDPILIANGTDITWYYNYGSEDTAFITEQNLEYVPQLWGNNSWDTFMDNVTSLINNGVNITSVIGFNEPDGCIGGGACMNATDAAKIWISQIEPLKKSHGLKLGSPATTGSQQGLQWMREFWTACNGSCNPDFLTAHFYGPFDGLSAWVGELYGYYGKNVTGGLWLTEFAYPNVNLTATQSFYNETVAFLDQWDFVKRYSYFGAFRSDVSNIGYNVSFFNGTGSLTDLGAWYLGQNGTNVNPTENGTSNEQQQSQSGAAGLKPWGNMVVVGIVALAGWFIVV